MGQATDTTKRLLTAVAALTLCCGFTTTAGCRHENHRAYTKPVVSEAVTPAVDLASPTSVPSEAQSSRSRLVDLRLLEYAWNPATIFGRILSWDTASDVQHTMFRWMRFLRPPGTTDRQRPWQTHSLATGEDRGNGSQPDRFMPGPYGTDWQGRMPSLVSIMASPLDTTMALDDVARGPDEGVRVGVRIVLPLSRTHDEAPIGFKFVGFGF